MLKGARYISKYYDGKIPKDVKDLLKIPSIGPYTAAAISSICYGLYHPVIDGNVKRILARLRCLSYSTKDPELSKKCDLILQKTFQEIKVHPGKANEAMMELGQKICTIKNPRLHPLSCKLKM